MAICCSRALRTPTSVSRRPPHVLSPSLSAHRRRGLSLSQPRRAVIACVGRVDAVSTEIAERTLPESLTPVKTGTVVVLFKHDLRVEDHPGLLTALNSKKQILPLYCLDAQLAYTSASMTGGVSLLWGGLQSLKTALRNLGSDLVFRMGRLSDVLLEIVEQTGSEIVVMETEVDSRWRAEIDRFRSEVGDVIVEEWTPAAVSRSNGGSLDGTDDLPSIPEDIDVGILPDVNDLRSHLLTAKNEVNPRSPVVPDLFERKDTALWDEWSAALTANPDACRRLLRSYLGQTTKDEENAGVDILKRLMQEIEDSSFPGVSFATLFSSALSLGLLSPGQVRREVKAAQGWRPWKTPFMDAALRNSLSYDRCTQLHTDILNNGCSGTPGNAEHQLWKFQSITAEYSIIRPKQPSKGAVVLIHGFGASCMHWRRNVDVLSAAGYTVYCPTLPGYGRSQTLYMKYTQGVWKAFMTGFLTEVVRQPAVLAGNSIGAYAAASTAADHPDLVDAVVLLNPAGPVEENYIPKDTEESLVKSIPPAFVVTASSRGLLLYLSFSAGRILKSVYPANKEQADAALLKEILEASKDPNAIAVMKSSFFLKKPVALNYLLKERYQKPVLLLQGVLDPMSDAGGRAGRLGDMCPNVQVELLEAGHCPHDEVPELVNPRFLAFLRHLHEQTQPSPVSTYAL